MELCVSSGKTDRLLSEWLGIQYPIIQGAMAHIATPEFAACVSNAGGLGIIATGSMSIEEASQAIDRCRQLTSRPFGVNVMMVRPDVEDMMEMIVSKHVDIVTTGAGNPGPWMKRLKDSGARVIPIINSVALARRMERAGADALIAEGCESGGHVGETTTMALVPQVVDAVDIPVIAAGGIADGRGMNAALCLGACGIQVGTCMLTTIECPVHEDYKQAVLKARDSSTTVTGRSQNAPVRILKNEMSRTYLRLEEKASSRLELEALTLGSLRRAVMEGDIRTGSVMMGQIAGLCQDIVPVQERLETIMRQSREEWKKTAGRRPV